MTIMTKKTQRFFWKPKKPKNKKKNRIRNRKKRKKKNRTKNVRERVPGLPGTL